MIVPLKTTHVNVPVSPPRTLATLPVENATTDAGADTASGGPPLPTFTVWLSDSVQPELLVSVTE